MNLCKNKKNVSQQNCGRITWFKIFCDSAKENYDRAYTSLIISAYFAYKAGYMSIFYSAILTSFLVLLQLFLSAYKSGP